MCVFNWKHCSLAQPALSTQRCVNTGEMSAPIIIYLWGKIHFDSMYFVKQITIVFAALSPGWSDGALVKY